MESADFTLNDGSLPMLRAETRPAVTLNWQEEMQRALRNGRELLDFCDLSPAALDFDPEPDFPCRVPRPWAARIRKGDPRDPLLLQVLPRKCERSVVPGFGTDPTGDLHALAGPGLLHKYRSRCLLVTTAACAVHCRYCFRRHFPYAEQTTPWPDLGACLQAHPDIREVILSGGDPLMLPTARLQRLAKVLEDWPQVQTLRLHTRMPVVLPARVDSELVDFLRQLPQQVVVVLHVNHARELDEETAAALAALRRAGVHLLNQAVLLRGVNDSTDSQRELCEALFTQGVLPYYLHLLDPVAGAAHFAIDTATALAMHAALRAVLPGYLVPRLAQEKPGEAAKRVLAG